MTLEDRLAALEQAVSVLTARADPPRSGPAAALDEELFLLDVLQQRFPAGAVAFAGHADTADGSVDWQWGRPTGELLEQEWDDHASALAALGHPVRLRLLRLVLTGTTTTAELADDPDLGTTGQLHHHLRTLLAAGWLSSAGRGRYGVPPQRVVPLLTIITATER